MHPLISFLLATLTPAIVILFMHSALANILRCIVLGRAILFRAPLFPRCFSVPITLWHNPHKYPSFIIRTVEVSA